MNYVIILFLLIVDERSEHTSDALFFHKGGVGFWEQQQQNRGSQPLPASAAMRQAAGAAEAAGAALCSSQMSLIVSAMVRCGSQK